MFIWTHGDVPLMQQHHAWANAPTARYWLCGAVLDDDGGCQG